ncbi:MAG: ATP-dependent acyl-CoA ligase [Acidimicrobiia bacterium]|nr:MAG: ATP-dependent acyl-CoA ligase [Acidimicrobiia bacterium]
MHERIGLLRGKGYPLGEHALRYPTEERTLLRLLSDQAASRGDQDWLIFDSTDHLTYREAWEESCQVAHAIEASVGKGAHVGIFLLNQLEFMPVFFGAMLNSGIAVPFNAAARGPLLHYVVEHSDAAVIVARLDLLDRLEALEDLGSVRLVVAVGPGDCPTAIGQTPVVPWSEWLASVPSTPPMTFPDYRQPCLIQYTSGTTGRQKGAVYPHQFLYLYPAMYVDSIGITADEILTTPMPLFHVAALHLIANAALHAGATAHLKSRFSASRYWEEAAQDGATFSIILGPMAALVMKSSPPAPQHRLSRIFCVPPPPEADEFERRYNTRLLWHAFGQTEISPLGMRPDILPGVPRDTLGYPVSWMEYGVVDDHDRLLPPGEVGEIVFRPMRPYSMFLEYYKDPQATLEAFRNFMYHTGDLGYYDEEGLLHYRGRKQERIRRRGENISAPELEYVALRHPKVVEAAAYGVPSELGEEDVKLDVRLSEPVPPAELHAWLVENLPRYMVPRYLEIRDSFPKTPSERIQKYLLQSLPLDRPEVHDFETR